MQPYYALHRPKSLTMLTQFIFTPTHSLLHLSSLQMSKAKVQKSNGLLRGARTKWQV